MRADFDGHGRGPGTTIRGPERNRTIYLCSSAALGSAAAGAGSSGLGGAAFNGFIESGTGVALSIGAVLRGANTTREPTSMKSNIRKIPRNRNAAMRTIAFTGLSHSRCMKNSPTRMALTLAIARAITTLAEPKLNEAAATVMMVRNSSANRFAV